MKRMLLFIAVLCLLTLCAGSSYNLTAEDRIAQHAAYELKYEKESYAVYSALLVRFVKLFSPLIISNETVSLKEITINKYIHNIRSRSLLLPISMVSDFKIKNQTTTPILPKFDEDLAYSLFDIQEFLDLHKGIRMWTEFELVYPGNHGIVSLSPVGFDEDMDDAIVYSSVGLIRMNLIAEMFIFTKEKGVWKYSLSVMLGGHIH